MKKLIFKAVLSCFLMITGVQAFAQPTSDAEAKEMAQKLMHMTPAQIMKFRDSMMKAVMQKQARALPNGDQLLIQHHYDTTYTTVHFYYTKTVSESHTYPGNTGSSTYICSGKSMKAPMIYEANGHTVVQCGMNPPGVSTAAIDKMVHGLNDEKKYATADQALKNQDVARQMAFSSMAVKDNSITGTASENSHYSGNQGNTIITTKQPIINMAFTFSYDPVQALSTVGVGANINIHTYSAGVDEFGHLQQHSSDDVTGLGMLGATDPHLAKMVGVAEPPRTDPDQAYIKVTKTAYGFKIEYTKTQFLRESNAHITETLNADIGGPEQQYEAVLKPMPKSKYETWLPKGPKVDGSDDTKGDDSAKFYVEVHDKGNPNKLYPGSFTVRYELKDITHYKGFNSNYPVYDGDEKADIRISDSTKFFSLGTFDPTLCTDSVATSVVNNGNLAIVQLTCMDYGAWAKLTAQVTLDDGSVLTASPYYDKGETFITIPFDRDENKIADAWEESEHIKGNGYGLDWDEDVKPDNGHPGDGITLIDEYRGFLTEDDSYNPIFKRFSPQKKELITIGLANLTANGNTFKKQIKDGAMNYGKASDVVIYHLTNSKYGYHEDVAGTNYGRWINYNSPMSKHAHGVVIYADDNRATEEKRAKALATTFPIFDEARTGFLGNMTPEDTKEIHLWTVYIINDVPFKRTEFMPDHPEGMDDFEQRMFHNIAAANAEFHVNIDPNHASPQVALNIATNIQHIISYTVSHELGHATNIHHHNAANPGPDDINYYKGSPNCVMRYWMDNHYPENCMTWMQMWIFGLWNPAAMVTPKGGTDYIKLCTTSDDCFHQMKLKKN